MLVRRIAGRYKVIDLLGQGSLGTVYLCWDEETKRQVAVKVLNGEAGQEAFDLFEREYTMLRNLRHPHIVEVFDIGQDRGVPYITMEHVQGRDFLRYGFSSYEEHARLLMQLLRALNCAHERGIVHRDVKASNVMVEVRPSSVDRVKLMDFNFATRNPGTDRCGTFEYMAPEVLLPDRFLAKGESVDDRSDLYSVGVLSYLLLTRCYPGGSADDRSGSDIVEGLLMERSVRPVTSIAPDVPVALENLVMRLLSRQRDARPRSALEAMEELRRIFPAVDADSIHLSGQSDRYPYHDASGIVDEVLRQHREGRSGLVVIRGHRRLGRTRSLEELAPQLARLGTEVISCAYTESGDPARGPLQRIPVRIESIHPEEGRDLRAKFPALYGSGTDGAGAGTSLRDQLASLLEREVARRPVAVLVDDVQWADPSFDTLLASARRVARTAGEGTCLLLVVTLSRDAAASATERIEGAIQGSGLPATSVELEPLAALQIRLWLESVGTWERIDEVVQLMEERGGGIPGLMEEILRDLQSARVVEASGGRWRVSTARLAEFRARVGHSDDGDFLVRLAALPLEDSNVLQVMAAFDRLVTVDEVEAVMSDRALDVAESMKRLVRGGYVQKIEYQYRIADASRRGQIYGAVQPASARSEIHLRIGRLLERLYQASLPEKLDEIARHLVRSPDRAAGLDFAMRAARRFMSQHQAVVALPRYTDAIELLEETAGGGSAADQLLLVEMHIEMTRCVLSALEPDQAMARAQQHLDRAGELLAAMDERIVGARWAAAFADARSYRWRHVDGELPDEIEECRRLLESHVAALAGDEDPQAVALRVELLRHLAYVCRRQRRFDDAIRLLEEGLTLARRSEGAGAARLLGQMTFCLSMSGNSSRAVAVGQEAVACAEGERDRLGLADAHKELALALTIDGMPALAREHYARAASVAEPWILGAKLPEIWQNHADLLSELCQSSEAIELAGKVLRFHPDGAGSLVARAHLVMGKALYRLCRYEEAEQQLALAMEYGRRRSQHGRDLAFCLQPQAYLGRIKVERGDHAGGVAMLRDVVDAVELRDRGRTNRHEFVHDCLLAIAKAMARRGWVERASGASTEATGREILAACAQMAAVHSGESPLAKALLACGRAMTGDGRAWQLGRDALDAVRVDGLAFVVADTAYHAGLAALVCRQARGAEELLGVALDSLREIQVLDLDIAIQALLMFALLEQGRQQPAMRFKKSSLQRMQEVLAHLDSEEAGMEFVNEPFRAEVRRQGRGVTA